MNTFFFSIDLFNHGVDNGNEYLGVIFHDLEERLSRIFDDAFDDADIAMFLVDDPKSDNFVEIELVACELGQEVERKVEVMADKRESLFLAYLLKGGHGFVAGDAVEVEEIGHEVAFDFHKGGVKLGIILRAINVKEHDNLSFNSEGLGDFAQVVAFFFGHRGLVVLVCTKKACLYEGDTLYILR